MSGFFSSRPFQIYIVPGAVFQSVLVGGGYGTGREIVEYFSLYGAIGGLLGLGVAFIAMAVLIALTFELSRLYQVYDYRNFCKLLLGRGWIIFEILIILQFLLVLAVLASAAGNILRDNFNIPYGVGLSIMLIVVGTLTFFGRALIEKVLTFWSFFLYAVFISFLVSILSSDWEPIANSLRQGEILSGWGGSGLKYTLYNIAVLPLLLYVAREFKTRKEVVGSSIIAATIAIIPAMILQIIFSAYPGILEQAIPAYWLMAHLGLGFLLIIYSVMLFGTFVETGAGLLQGINDRIDIYLIEQGREGLSRLKHAAIAVFAIITSAILSLWGITNLIAEGYGTMAWGFLAIYVLPLVTIGLYKIITFKSGKVPVS